MRGAWRSFWLLVVAGSLVCSLPVQAKDEGVGRLVRWMAGSFSSRAQSVADTSYFDIRLEMKPIWADRTDGAWLYVEQAAASALARPYRQRIYHVTADSGGVFRSAVLELRSPLRFAGAFKNPALLAALTPDSLIAREGCAVLLRADGNQAFSGETPGHECLSNLRGATYATSKVRITPTSITSWDQGWNAEGKQVWGAENGPYRFDRIGK